MRTNTPKCARVTEAQIADALRACGGLFAAAAQKLGVNPSTVSRRVGASANLQAVVRESMDKRLDMAEAALMKAIDRGEPWAVCFFLKCKGKGRGYVERTEIAPVGANDAESPAAKLSDEELDRIIAAGEGGKG